MNIKYLNKLEFNKILEILSDFCVTGIGKDLAKNLKPETNKSIVFNLLKETTDAITLIYKKHAPSFIDIIDLTYISKTLESNGILSTKNLLDIANILKLSYNLKTYFTTDNEESATFFPALEQYFCNLYTNKSVR